MVEKLKVAIIGAGIGSQHLHAYLQLPERFEVQYLCDKDTARASEVVNAEKAGTDSIQIESELNTVLQADEIDLIDICLPPHLHLSASIATLEAGKHVICEKPLVSSLKDSQILETTAQKNGRKVLPVFQYRYGPAIHKLKALIAKGLAGKPLIASVETHWNRDTEYYNNPWRGTWKGEQGGAVLGHAIHNHDLLCAIMGPVKKLSAFGATRVNDIETEDCASISFLMENGSLTTSSITLGAYNNATRLKFCFEHLTAESDLLPYSPAEGEWTFNVRGDKYKQSEIDAFLANLKKPKSGFVGFLEAVADTLQHGGENSVTLEDGRRSIELVTAIYHSMRSGEQVELPLSKTHPLFEGWLPPGQ